MKKKNTAEFWRATSYLGPYRKLVVASIGYEYHLINRFGLTVLVLTALVTTVVTTPVIHILQRVDCAIAPTVGSDMTKSAPVSVGPVSD